jgi:hypothetical protein
MSAGHIQKAEDAVARAQQILLLEDEHFTIAPWLRSLRVSERKSPDTNTGDVKNDYRTSVLVFVDFPDVKYEYPISGIMIQRKTSEAIAIDLLAWVRRGLFEGILPSPKQPTSWSALSGSHISKSERLRNRSR